VEKRNERMKAVHNLRLKRGPDSASFYTIDDASPKLRARDGPTTTIRRKTIRRRRRQRFRDAKCKFDGPANGARRPRMRVYTRKRSAAFTTAVTNAVIVV